MQGILALNLCLSLAILTSSVNGFDSSLLNGEKMSRYRIARADPLLGLQILPDWSGYFGNPSGSVLGLLSSAQNLVCPHFSYENRFAQSGHLGISPGRLSCSTHIRSFVKPFPRASL